MGRGEPCRSLAGDDLPAPQVRDQDMYTWLMIDDGGILMAVAVALLNGDVRTVTRLHGML